MILNFGELTLKNFISTGAQTQTVDLSSAGLTLILGYFLDTNGDVERNGAGKSTIMHALSYVLYGKGIEGGKVDTLVNDINQKNMLVTLDFHIGKNSYRVERGRKPTIFRFLVNNEELKKDDANDTRGASDKTQEALEEVIGMDHTMFCHLVCPNTSVTPFFKMSAADQRDMIEKLLGFVQLSQRAAVLSKKIKSTKGKIESEAATIEGLIEANRRIQATIDAAQRKVEDWSKEHVRKIADLKDSIAAANEIDFDRELELLVSQEAYEVKMKQLEASLKELEGALQIKRRERSLINQQIEADKSHLTRLKLLSEQDSSASITKSLSDSIRLLTNAIQQDHETAISRAQKALDDNAHAIEHANGSDCSTCGQSLEGTNHLEGILTNLNTERTRLEARLQSALDEKSKAETKLLKQSDELEAHKIKTASEQATKVAEYEEALKNFSTQTTEIVDEEIVIIEGEIKSVQSSIKDMGTKPKSMFQNQAEIFTIKQHRDSLVTELARVESEENPFTAQADALTGALQEVDYSELEAARLLLKHQDYMFKLLTNKDSFVRKKIIDQNLTNLNSRLQHYATLLVGVMAKFNNDLSIDLIRNGKEYDWPQLSRGEKNRVILAMSWAFRDVWEGLNQKVGLMFIDELLDSGMSTIGSENALKVIKGMARENKSVFLISHKEELRGRIDRTIMVNRDDGFSRFIVDAF
jgi:DNA repair exonuclease SbcCD ATPase subunit